MLHFGEEQVFDTVPNSWIHETSKDEFVVYYPEKEEEIPAALENPSKIRVKSSWLSVPCHIMAHDICKYNLFLLLI